jgi:hypothetical protein
MRNLPVMDGSMSQLFLAVLLFWGASIPAIAAQPFKVADRGPHGGALLRATPKGPHTEIPGQYEKLYFEMIQTDHEIVLYSFLVLPDKKGFVVPAAPKKELPEIKVNARFAKDKRDIKISTYTTDDAIHGVCGAFEAERLGVKSGDSFDVNVVVIHEGMSKEALFHTYRK